MPEDVGKRKEENVPPTAEDALASTWQSHKISPAVFRSPDCLESFLARRSVTAGDVLSLSPSMVTAGVGQYPPSSMPESTKRGSFSVTRRMAVLLRTAA